MRRRRGLVASILVAATACTGVIAATTEPIVHAATVPAGFNDALVASFSSPTAVEWLPSDQLVVLEKGGTVRVGSTTDGDFGTALTLNVCSNSERGLLGFTHDAAFLSNGYVYVYYTRPDGDGCVNRVSRFTMVGSTIAPASEVVLLDRISSINGNHNGGDLDVTATGELFVAVGDAGRDPRGDSGTAGDNDAAQDTSLLNGKILRITTDGLPAAGNPFTGPGTARCAFRGNTADTPTTACQEIYATGVRNPYRIAFDPNAGTDRFYINDVGQNTFEEVNEGGPNINYGWPVREGSCPQGDTPPCDGPPPAFTDPITSYGRDFGRSITGGAFVPNGLWPAEFDGDYLFGDYVTGDIWRMDETGAVDYDEPFATGANGLTDMTFGFHAGEPALFYTTFSSVRVITPPQGDPIEAPDLKYLPVPPRRAYDSSLGEFTDTPGWLDNGTSRLIDLDAPAEAQAALVNLTMDSTAGAGFLRAWAARTPRPETSSVNADAAGTIVANSAIVPLTDGEFVLESTTSGRVIVDVMGWFVPAPEPTTDGRFVPLDPARLVDTRIPAGTELDSGSSNPWRPDDSSLVLDGSAAYVVDVAGAVGVPDDGTVGAIAVSLTTTSGDVPGGFVGAHPTDREWTETSNVNVTRFDARANLAVVPLAADGTIRLETFQVEDVIVDVVGYFTSDAAAASTSGLYQSISTFRIVDTRDEIGFDRLVADVPSSVALPGSESAGAVVQNLTVTETSAAGHLSTHPTPTTPFVSNLNYTGPGQTRAVLAFTKLTDDGSENYTSFVDTDLVVDVLGYFTD
jgi:glucose/arabinose dehydrogenase